MRGRTAAHANRVTQNQVICTNIKYRVRCPFSSIRCLTCRSAEFEDVPLFSGSTDLFGPKAAGAVVTKSESVSDALDAVELKSGRGIDYEPLRVALKQQEFERADDIHRKKLIEVAGADALERGWVYFSEVKDIPAEDLQTINQLWLAASGGKFGFSVQRSVWKACSKKWSAFFQAIDWLKGENLNYRAWPKEFVYDVKQAAKGHLPLTNALRGTQLLEAILSHPAFDTKDAPAWSE